MISGAPLLGKVRAEGNHMKGGEIELSEHYSVLVLSPAYTVTYT